MVAGLTSGVESATGNGDRLCVIPSLIYRDRAPASRRPTKLFFALILLGYCYGSLGLLQFSCDFDARWMCMELLMCSFGIQSLIIVQWSTFIIHSLLKSSARAVFLFLFILEKPATRPRDRCGKEQHVALHYQFSRVCEFRGMAVWSAKKLGTYSLGNFY